MQFPTLRFLTKYRLKSRHTYAIIVIAIVVMAGMVIALRGKSQQMTVLDVSNLNGLESSYYVRLNNTIWQDTLNNASQWHVSYSQPNMTAQVTANGVLHLNATIASEQYAQVVSLYRSVNFSLAQSPVLLISLGASVGIHYGIRISGQDSSGNLFQAWSESSDLQHRSGLGRTENFTISAAVEAYKANGVFPAAGSSITSLLFYMEATAGQTGRFALNVYGMKVATPNQYSFSTANQVRDTMDEITLVLNSTNGLGYSDDQFAQGYIDYYVSGTVDLVYTIYYLHGRTVVGQGFVYSSSVRTYNIATFSGGRVAGGPPFLTGNNTYSIIIVPIKGAFLSFQLVGFSVRYLSQAPIASTQTEIDAGTILAYYLAFLFVTPVTIVILLARLFSHETKQAS